MWLTYFGHACFQIKTSGGFSVFMDPFDERVGYPLPQGHADVVTVSHHHGDHDHIGRITGPCRVVDTQGEHDLGPVRIRSVATHHDDAGGALRGENLVHIVSCEGLSIAHMGDLGHMLSEGQILEVGKVDIMLLPVGGYYTIDAQAARQVWEAVRPRLTIPMHYKTPQINFPIADERGFLNLMENQALHGTDSIELTPQILEQMPQVLLMAHP